MHMCSLISDAMKGSQLERSPLDLTYGIQIRERSTSRVEFKLFTVTIRYA